MTAVCLFFSILSVSKAFTVEFICQFEVSLFPFDTQKCKAVIALKGKTGKFVKLVPTLEFNGPTDLASYVVTNTRLLPSEQDDKMEIEITLGRRIFNDIMEINFPTLILVLVMYYRIYDQIHPSCGFYHSQISFTTNYFGHDEFKAAVGVNLTCLLVNVTLFTSVSAK